jgi:hypothetical protein
VIHPDRQAAQLLKLFEGSSAPHPAAALSAWKRATRDPAQLGKTLEAVIALANPEMVREWTIFHQAELRMNFSRFDGALGWHCVVPRDDGAAAAMITAFRLSDLEDAPPVIERGREFVVTRFIRTGSVLMTQVGTTLVLGSSRDELGRVVRRLDPGIVSLPAPPVPSIPAGPSNRENEIGRLAGTLPPCSGLVFDLRPRQIATPTSGSMELRRAIELLHGLGCAQTTGTLALEGDRLSLDLTTEFEVRDQPVSGVARPSVDPAWLALVPAKDLVGIVSLAFDANPRYWNRLFADADRVERVDPAYRDVASLRTRFNLHAMGGGLRPEADLWPHLRGITAAAVGDPKKPGRIGGGLVVLHADTAASAARLADDFVPRLTEIAKGKLALRTASDTSQLKRQAAAGAAAPAASSNTRRLGTLGGRLMAVRCGGRDVLVGWGDERTMELLSSAGECRVSAADLCAGWGRENKPAPSRAGALWLGRLASPLSAATAASPAARVLADDPPLVWWGWNDKGEAHDVVFWSDLKRRVQRFLEALPMDASPYH